MNFNLTFTPNEHYYKEAYSEIISLQKIKKYEPIFAIIMVIVGFSLYYFDENKKLGFFPFIFSSLGIYEFSKSYFGKKKWLKERLGNKIAGQQIEIDFNDNKIKYSEPFANGELSWTGIKDIIKTKKGILLKPENGISIYLPYQLFSDKEQIAFLLSKKKTLHNSKQLHHTSL